VTAGSEPDACASHDDAQFVQATCVVVKRSTREAVEGGRVLTIAQSDSLRFYKVPTSYSSTDRILLTLACKYPSRFEQVCTGEFSPREIALELGWTKIPAPTLRRFMDDAAALSDTDQADLLLQLFKVITDEARAVFLANLGVHKGTLPEQGEGP
jgi:hypothetical protein